MKSYVYLLHFDDANIGAHHYAGVSGQLPKRLAAHAAGRGSSLTRLLHARGVPWELAAVWSVSENKKYAVERHLKATHNLSRYCPICSVTTSNPLDGVPIDPANVPFDRAALVEAELHGYSDISIRLTTSDDQEQVSAMVKRMMKSDRNALGFIPAGGPQGLTYLIDRGMIALVSMGSEVAGYCAFTKSLRNETLKIQQVCVEDQFRLAGCGAKLVEHVRGLFPDFAAQCNVADDLPANLFWQSIGFQVEFDFLHMTSGRKLNHYVFQTKQPERKAKT